VVARAPAALPQPHRPDVAERFRQRIEDRGGFHVFMGATFTPGAKRVFRQIAENPG
jgi:hypothetical protein